MESRISSSRFVYIQRTKDLQAYVGSFQFYQAVEAACDGKTYLFLILAAASSVPNGKHVSDAHTLTFHM